MMGDAKHRERLGMVMAQLDAAGESPFLDLCELVLMLSERTDGMIKFNHPRVVVHIKLARRARGCATGVAKAG